MWGSPMWWAWAFGLGSANFEPYKSVVGAPSFLPIGNNNNN